MLCVGLMPAKQLLKDKDKKFRILFQQNPQPMWVLNPQDQHFLEVNSAACNLYGYSSEEFRSMSLSDIQVQDEGVQPEAQSFPTPQRHRTKNGRVLEVEMAVHD